MKFHERETSWDIHRREKLIPKHFTPRDLHKALWPHQKNDYCRAQVEKETDWIESKRPYYNVYPSLYSMLIRTKLNVHCDYVKHPTPGTPILLRFPEGREPMLDEKGERMRPRSILLCEMSLTKFSQRGLILWIDCGEKCYDYGYESPFFHFQSFCLVPGISIEQSLRDYTDFNESEWPNSLRDAVKLCVGVCLLAQNPDMIEPDILSKDRSKYPEPDAETLARLQCKAHRRGKIGWCIGRGLEVSPHQRGAHMGWRWTGPGKSIPKYVPIKGSFIHKDKVTEVPTGSLDEEKSDGEEGKEGEE